MKIAFDAQLFLKGNKTGIAWYAENIIKGLQLIKTNEYDFNYFSLGYSKDKLLEMKRYEEDNSKLNSCSFFNDIIYKLIWPFIPISYSTFFGKKADITLFFNYAICPGVQGKKVVIIYDMAYKTCPETVRKKTRYWLNLILKRSCKRADLIITISEFSKIEILKYLNINENKIAIVPCGVDSEKFHTNYTKEEIIKCKIKYGIKEDYLLYLGTLEPRKNIVSIIEAYGILKKKEQKNSKLPKLVLAGGKGWYYDSIFAKVDELKLNEDIIFTGYVLEEEVPLLMNGAKLFLFPSLYEGFGMPPLEAMACGTPVIVSNVASLPEVVGEAGKLVDPYDTYALCDEIHKLIYDEEAYKAQILIGLERVKEFSWEKHIDKFSVLLSKLV